MTDLTIYTIPAANLAGLLFKVSKLSKKSVKINGKSIALTIVEEVRKPRTTTTSIGQRMAVTDAEGNPVFDISYKVTIDAEVPKIHGWTFLATIDHAPTTGNIIRINPNVGFPIPVGYRSVTANCDHCGKIRKRNDTFLLRCDATGEMKQIGRQCIRDFIGYDVQSVVAMAEIVRDAAPNDGDGDCDLGGMRNQNYIYARSFLAHTSTVVRGAGWMSRKQGEIDGRESTASQALSNMFPPRPMGKFVPRPLVDKDFEIADAALAWGATLEGKTDYEYNLSIVARESFIGARSIGILASLVPAYMRHMEQEFKKAERRNAEKQSLKLDNSQHIGAIGQRLRDVSAVLYGYMVLPGDQYGPRHMFRFLTNDGDVLVWFASHLTVQDMDMGMIEANNRTAVIITGTVVKHSDYLGVKQTLLNRCKVNKFEQVVS